jgi:hypothetical protein
MSRGEGQSGSWCEAPSAKSPTYRRLAKRLVGQRSAIRENRCRHKMEHHRLLDGEAVLACLVGILPNARLKAPADAI